MKHRLKYNLLPIIAGLLLLILLMASIPRAPEIPGWFILAMFVLFCLFIYNCATVIANVILKSRRLRIFNVLISGVFLLSAIYFAGSNWEAQWRIAVIAGLHALVIGLSTFKMNKIAS